MGLTGVQIQIWRADPKCDLLWIEISIRYSLPNPKCSTKHLAFLSGVSETSITLELPRTIPGDHWFVLSPVRNSEAVAKSLPCWTLEHWLKLNADWLSCSASVPYLTWWNPTLCEQTSTHATGLYHSLLPLQPHPSPNSASSMILRHMDDWKGEEWKAKSQRMGRHLFCLHTNSVGWNLHSAVGLESPVAHVSSSFLVYATLWESLWSQPWWDI